MNPFENKEPQRCRGAEMQRRRGAEAQRRRGAEAQRRRDAVWSEQRAGPQGVMGDPPSYKECGFVSMGILPSGTVVD